MTPRILLLSLSLLLTGGAATAATPPEFLELDFRFQMEGIRVGMTKEQLVTTLGLPSEVVGTDTWIYREFDYPHPTAVKHGYDTLIVGVVDERVTVMKLVNGKALNALLKANAEARAAQARVMAQAETRAKK